MGEFFMSKSVIRTQKNRENPYVMIDKTFLNDDRLSWKAKGLLSYFLSKPDDWRILVNDLIKRSKDGERAVRSGLKELEENGYLTNEPIKNQKGQIEYWEKTVYERPIDKEENPDVQNSNVAKNPDGRFVHVENADVENVDVENVGGILINEFTKNEFTNKRSQSVVKKDKINTVKEIDQIIKNNDRLTDDIIYPVYERFKDWKNFDIDIFINKIYDCLQYHPNGFGMKYLASALEMALTKEYKKEKKRIQNKSLPRWFIEQDFAENEVAATYDQEEIERKKKEIDEMIQGLRKE